jgi:hypothetical protein
VPLDHKNGHIDPERDVLRRMLNTPPQPHKPKAKKPKAPKKKPA